MPKKQAIVSMPEGFRGDLLTRPRDMDSTEPKHSLHMQRQSHCFSVMHLDPALSPVVSVKTEPNACVKSAAISIRAVLDLSGFHSGTIDMLCPF